jgi:methionyl-tRNA synthetase
VDRYHERKVPAAGPLEPADRAQLDAIHTQAKKSGDHLDHFRFKAALAEVMALARAGNVYFDARQPWVQRREQPGRCATTLNVCLHTVKALAVLMEPFLPFSARRCARMLNVEDTRFCPSEIDVELPAGHRLNEPALLYRRLDAAEPVPGGAAVKDPGV